MQNLLLNVFGVFFIGLTVYGQLFILGDSQAYAESLDPKRVTHTFLKMIEKDLDFLAFSVTVEAVDEPSTSGRSTREIYEVSMDNHARIRTNGFIEEVLDATTAGRRIPIFSLFADGTNVYEKNYLADAELRYPQMGPLEGVSLSFDDGLPSCSHGSYLKSWLGHTYQSAFFSRELRNGVTTDFQDSDGNHLILLESKSHRFYFDPVTAQLMRWDTGTRSRRFANIRTKEKRPELIFRVDFMKIN